ncbi:MAG: hypothetical protein ACYDBB_02135 [Armatimonadota bacterium]
MNYLLSHNTEVEAVRPIVRLYVASPITTYQTLRYDRMLTMIRHSFPDCELLPAREMFPNTETWKTSWPTVLACIDALIFFDDGKRIIGRGVYHETLSAHRQGKPIYYLSDDGLVWCYPSGVYLDLIRQSNQEWARVKIKSRAVQYEGGNTR